MGWVGLGSPVHTSTTTTVVVRPTQRLEKKGDGLAYRASANVALLQFPEPIAIRARLVHLTEGDVHEVVAVDEMAVERFTVFQFYKLLVTCVRVCCAGDTNWWIDDYHGLVLGSCQEG